MTKPLDEMRDEVEDFVEAPESVDRFRVVNESLLDELTARASREPEAIATPWPSMNVRCGDEGGKVGLALGWHNLVAGLTGTGKSLIGLQIMGHALAQGYNACYVSNEMSRQQLITRLLAQVGETKVAWLEPGEDFDPEVRKECDRDLARLPGTAHINDVAIGYVNEIEEVVRWHVKHYDVRIFVFDYLQLIDVEYEASVAERVRVVSHRVRELAQKYRFVSVGLTQFSRQQTSEEPPSIFNLKGGSTLEQDSDTILMIDHSRYQRNSVTGEAFAYLNNGKNRHGPTGRWPVMFNYDHLKVRELDYIPSWVRGANVAAEDGEKSKKTGAGAS